MNWIPRYEEVTIPGTTMRVPKRFFGYTVGESLVPSKVADYQLLRLGKWGPFVGMYLNPATDEVVTCVDRPMAQPRLVNSTLALFRATTKAVIALFPYYDRRAELEDREAVAARVAKVIGAIDEPAMTPDTFWATFVDDLVIGDFATEDILEPDRSAPSEP